MEEVMLAACKVKNIFFLSRPPCFFSNVHFRTCRQFMFFVYTFFEEQEICQSSKYFQSLFPNSLSCSFTNADIHQQPPRVWRSLKQFYLCYQCSHTGVGETQEHSVTWTHFLLRYFMALPVRYIFPLLHKNGF